MGILVRAHLGDDRESANFLGGKYRLPQLCKTGECLQDQQLHTAFLECLDLFAEDSSQLAQAMFVRRLQGTTGWPYRSSNEDGLTGYFTRLECQARGAMVDLTYPLLEVIAFELGAVRAEGVGFDDLRSGTDILTVNALNKLWLCQVECIETLLIGHAARIEKRAHGAITEQRPLLQLFE